MECCSIFLGGMEFIAENTDLEIGCRKKKKIPLKSIRQLLQVKEEKNENQFIAAWQNTRLSFFCLTVSPINRSKVA